MIVSKANQFVFRLIKDVKTMSIQGDYTENRQMQTIDNTLQCDFKVYNKNTIKTIQAINYGQFEIQVIVLEGRNIDTFLTAGLSFVSKTLRDTIDGRDYYSIIIDVTAEGYQKILLVEGDGGNTIEAHESEEFISYNLTDTEMSDKGYLKIEYSNDDNKYLFDYRDKPVNKMFVLGRMVEYIPKINQNIFDNDEETLNQKTTVQRTLKLETTNLNTRVAELLTVALSHEYFFINSDQFTMEEKPEITFYSNFAEMSVILTQNNVIGLNTYGFVYPDEDCEGTEPVYIMINPVPLSYIPAATGNTQNLNEFVIASDGTKWFIDHDGKATKFTQFPEFREEITNFLAGANFVTPSYLPSGNYDVNLFVDLNGSVLRYTGATAVDKMAFGVDNGNIYFARKLKGIDKITIFGNRN